MDWIISQENTLRLTIFGFGFFLFFVIGLAIPFRAMSPPKQLSRWRNNILLIVANGLTLKLLAPFSLAGFAIFISEKNWGLLQLIEIPMSVEIVVSLVVLDAWIYWQHRLFHAAPLLWRLHRLHHSDIAFDVTTAGRFHPIEIILSFFIKALAIFVFGISAAAIILFEVLLNLNAMFNHSNFSLPPKFEGMVRRFIVTPSMHRIHHSPILNETNSNYGFCLSCWDRFFSSYRESSSGDPKTMEIGLTEFRSAEEQTLRTLLAQPLK